MYVPTHVPSTNIAQNQQNYENVVYTTRAEDTYQTPQTSQYPSGIQYQQNYQLAQSAQPQGKYIQEQIIKKEPKSLLDSYIPSYLQVQYYNRQQQQPNYVQEPVVKIPRKKNYKSSSHIPAESSLRYSYQASPYKFKR